MGFFSAVKRFFTGGNAAEEKKQEQPAEEVKAEAQEEAAEASDEPEAAEEPAKAEAEPEEAPAEAAAEAPAKEVEEAPAAPALSATAIPVEKPTAAPAPAADPEEEALSLALRQAEPKLSAWLSVVLKDVEEADDLLWKRLGFLLRALETPESEATAFIEDFRGWLKRMDYRWLEDFRSELQYRLAIALDMEDEEDERDRLFSKLQAGLARTTERFGQGLKALFSGHTELTPAFWDEMEELFIMADMGA
ncbi:MAG: signal recognition particle-docking protein FtsY, partial [Mailhella sp.]|nr:signal recognition particle-docking protein FtsY [Mailhella sp.]